MRLLRICREFGRVAVVTPQSGGSTLDGIEFMRLVTGKEFVVRSARAAIRRAGALLPEKWRAKWIRDFTDEALGIVHQGINFRRLWRKHRLQPQLLILDGAEFMTTAGKLARKAGAKTVYYVHEMFPNQCAHYSQRLTAWYCSLERSECRHASKIIVQHHLWGKLLRRRYRLPASRFVEVTPSPELQEPLPGSEPGEPLRLYYHGLFAAGRQLEIHIRAAAMVPGVEFDLRGRGPFEEELRKVAEESGAADRIRFLPALPTAELAASARRYDLGLVTGGKNHLNGRMSAGIKLYENMAAGIGLFGYRAVTLRNTVRRFGIGFNYDSSSPERVAETLRYCVAHRDEVKAARENAVRAARQYFNSDTQFERLRGVIREALEAAPQQE